MPNIRSQRKVLEDKSRKGRLSEKSSSFHSGSLTKTPMTTLRRPKTDPELLSFKNLGLSSSCLEGPPKMTKLLLNVTIQGSVGPVQVLMSPETTVSDLLTATLRQYAKEFRRPILPTTDSSGFDLHYSQFSLESLDREEKLIALGSRNFFLCLKKLEETSSSSSSSSSCSKQAENSTKSSGSFNWFKFIDFRT